MILSNRIAWFTALAGGVCGVGALIAACGGSSGGGNGSGSGSGSGGGTTGDGGGVSTQPGSCANPTIGIAFSPMYSSYIPNSTAQSFQIPAVTTDGNTATWSLSDPSQANLQAQSFTVGTATTPGVMITINGNGAGSTGVGSVGTVTVIATESGGACGSATLNITQSSEDLWNVGNARYNDGDNLHLGGGPGDGGFNRPEGGFPEGGFNRPEGGGGGGGGFTLSDGGSPFETDGGTACTSCHGPTAVQFLFKDVQHTPEQTGGFSDNDLTNIILNGVVPDGGYFDPSVLDGLLNRKGTPGLNCDDAGTTLVPGVPECFTTAYTTWQGFHQWVDITSDEMPGVITYLRALPPAAQSGNSNFGGGGHHHDGGGAPPPADSGTGGTDSGGGGSDASGD